MVMEKLKAWWTLDEAAEAASADNPLTPLSPHQRRETGPLLTLAFGWGFLVTGLFTGGAVGAGVPFWPDLIWTTFAGNFVNFVIGALVGYMGYKTACNSGLLYRLVYGKIGAFLPVLFLAALTIGWQGIVVGAFGLAWTGSFESTWFVPVALFAGLLYTATTYIGVKALEVVSLPACVLLVVVGVYAGWVNIDRAGGWDSFLALSQSTAVKAPITNVQAINLVIGSWIVGAIVMAEYTRFARKAWVALAIPFIVLIISQWFLQVIGAMGGVVSGNFDFSAYLMREGMIIGGIGLITISVALWTTGDTNLYLPSIQTAATFRRPTKAMVVVCGLLGTILGLGIYQWFMGWINLLAAIVPPLIGPVIVDYYVIHRARYTGEDLAHAPTWNPAAVGAYAIGAASTFLAPDWVVDALLGLGVSMIAYLALWAAMRGAGMQVGLARKAAT
jgi:cytosine permease